MKDEEGPKEQLIVEPPSLRKNLTRLEGAKCLSGQADESSLENSRRYRLLADNIADVMWVSNLQSPSRLAYVSPSVTGLLGYTVEEAISRTMEEVFTPQSVQVSRRALAEEFALVSRGDAGFTRSRVFELELLHKNGSIVPVEVRFTYLPGPDGDPAEILAVARDISERKRVEQDVRRSTDRLLKAMEDTMHALARVVEMRDPYTAGHQRRTTELACAIADGIGMSADRITGLRLAGLIHDIGKVRVPAEILTNPDALSSPEFAIIRTHPSLGYEILKTIELPWPVADIVRQHHERMDGSGYPDGLRGESIIKEARILAVADVVEAIASHRPYRPALGTDHALQEISNNRGRLYDKEAVDSCLVLFRERAFEFH